MTPKEQAEKLVQQFSRYTWNGEDNLDISNAKQCALILVDEIRHTLFAVNTATILDCDLKKLIQADDYWNEVIKEIKKL